MAGGFKGNGIPQQPWDALATIASMAIRLEAAQARLKQAVLILDNLDRTFPRTLSETVDSAAEEIRAALAALIETPEPVVVAERAPRITVPSRWPKTAEYAEVHEWPYLYRKTARRETVALLALGYTSEEIGKQLHQSTDCIKSRLWKAYRDMGVPNAPALVNHAWEAGVLPYIQIEVASRITLPLFRPTPTDHIPSKRERQVLALIARGEGRDGAAKALGLRPLTVKSHLDSMLTKCRVENSTALVNHAWSQGWLGVVDVES